MPSDRLLVPSIEAFAPLPTVGFALVSGGQFVAQAPEQLLLVPLSAWNTYSVRPWLSSRILPRLLFSTPTVGKGANASMLGTSKRSDGKTQVTYNGHPLYTFAGDSGPGDTSGQGVNAFGGLWYVLSPAGQQVTTSGSNNSGGGIY